MLRKVLFVAMLSCAVLGVGTAQAIPVLQLYIEGATYDASSETWVTGAGSFRLWVIGDVEHFGSISDVSLTAAYLTGESGSISLTATTAGGVGSYLGVTDPSTPVAPSVTIATSADGQIPTLSDGSNLPTHGIFGPGTTFTQWYLGNFTLSDSPIGDWISSFPSTFPDDGQINAYDVVVTGFSQVHFDAFDHITAGNHTQFKFAPFSHDAGTQVPEPSTVMLLGGGLMGLIGPRFRKR